MVNKYPKSLFVVSTAITVAIFLAGVMLGWGLDSFKETEILGDIKINELDTESYLAEQELLQNVGGDLCLIFEPRMNHMKYILNETGGKLPNSKETASNIDLDYLKRKYFISEVKFLNMLYHVREECGKQVYLPVLFFYTKDDTNSAVQGVILTWLNKRYEDKIIVMSFDKDYTDEPLVKTLMIHYNVTSSATIIIGDKKFDGPVSKDVLEEELMKRI